MKLTEIMLQPALVIEFERLELELLHECTRSHYDSRCRMYASKIEGMLAQLDEFERLLKLEVIDTPCRFWLSVSDLDTFAKIVEMGVHLPDRDRAQKCAQLQFMLRRVWVTADHHAAEPVQINLELAIK